MENIKKPKLQFKQLQEDSTVEPMEVEFPKEAGKTYGRMVVLLERGTWLITLGPDYICFMIAFLCFGGSGVFLVLVVNEATEVLVLRGINIVLVIVQCGCYLVLALSNPGIAQKGRNHEIQEEGEDDIKRYCKVCAISMLRKQYHCKECDVCIFQYDHHCPWTSKCIGARNMNLFMFFVGYTPVYMVYYLIALMAAMAVNAGQHHANLT